MKHAQFKHPFPVQVQAFFTDTTVDFIFPPDAKGLSPQQKEFLKKYLKFDHQKVYTMRQVHGNSVLTITAGDIPQKGGIPEADAMVTNVPGIVLTVRTADCLPVFLYDPQKKCIGLAHAGWKGSALKIAEKTVEAMNRNYGSKPSDILAAFGPAIRECCYEVGEEFKESFPREVSFVNNKRCLDLPLVNKNQLLAAGLKISNIMDSENCTVCGPGFFSFRRDKEKAGRHLSIIYLE